LSQQRSFTSRFEGTCGLGVCFIQGFLHVLPKWWGMWSVIWGLPVWA
jgi:hypothetical protein